MNFHPASGLSIVSFVAIIVAICFLFLAAVGVVSERLDFSVNREVVKAGGALLVWLGSFTILVATGILRHWTFPWVPLLIALMYVFTFFLCVSSYGARFALAIPVRTLIAFQIVRLPMELIFHQWALQGTIPMTMTWTGRNLEIVAGFLALFALWIARIKTLAWSFNVLGLLLLFNVSYVAVMSSPASFGWHVQPVLQLFFFMPYFLVLPVYVVSIFAGHILLTRALLYGR